MRLSFKVFAGSTVLTLAIACGAAAPSAPIVAESIPPHSTEASARGPGAVIALAAGGEHSCALFASGKVACWGGVGTPQYATSARRMAWSRPTFLAGISSATAIAAHGSQTCALLRDRTVSCFSALDSHAAPPRPVPVPGLDSVVEISVGGMHACARRDDGTVWCWGSNSEGQLGVDPSAMPSSDAAVRVRSVSGAAEIDSGGSHTCVRMQDGTVSCWGNATAGQLGQGETPMQRSATPVRVQVPPAVSLATGNFISCVVTREGAGVCWGARLGGDPHGPGMFPTTPETLFESGDVASVVASNDTACVITRSSVVRCATYRDEQAQDMWYRTVRSEISATSAAVGNNHACVLFEGNVSCWGSNSHSQLGNAGVRDGSRPRAVIGISDAVAISTGDKFTCAVHADERVSCWGRTTAGALGYFDPSDSAPLPRIVENVSAFAISSGQVATCAIAANRSVSCWGDNQSGTLGDGTEEQRVGAVRVVGITDAQAVDVTLGHLSIVRANGDVVSWGRHGNANVMGVRTRVVPDARKIRVNIWGAGCALSLHQSERSGSLQTAVAGPLQCWANAGPTGVSLDNIMDFDVRDEGACAIKRDGSVWCWTWGDHTWLSASPQPTQVGGLTDATAIALGGAYACATTQARTVRCWGARQSNEHGQLGRGNYEPSNSVEEVAGLGDVIAIDAGEQHTCALLANRTIRCWGDNTYGALGDGEVGGVPAFSLSPLQPPAQVSFGYLR